MATASPFNTLKYAKRLEAAKFSPEQAEVQSEVLAEVLEERDKALAEQAQALAAVQTQLKNQQENHDKTTRDMATKADIALVRKDVDLVRKDVDLVRKDMEALGNKLVIRLTVVMGALIGLALAAQRYLPPPAH